MHDTNVRRLASSWILLVIAWPVYDVAEDRQWLSVVGLIVLVRVAAIYLGVTAIWRLRRSNG